MLMIRRSHATSTWRTHVLLMGQCQKKQEAQIHALQMVECMNALDGKANKWNNMKFIWFICAIIESVSKSNSVLWFQCACEVIVDYFTCISRLWNWTSTLTIKFTRSGDMQICKSGRQKGNLKRKTKNRISVPIGVGYSRCQPFPPPQKKKHVFFSNLFSISHLTPSRYSQMSFFFRDQLTTRNLSLQPTLWHPLPPVFPGSLTMTIFLHQLGGILTWRSNGTRQPC